MSRNQSIEMTDEELELIFISGSFMEIDVPKDKEYLLKYLRTPLQQQFVQYFLIFGTRLKRFSDHTGFACNPWWVRDLKRKVRKLERAKEKAKKEMDFETLVKIETGKCRLSRLNKA